MTTRKLALLFLLSGLAGHSACKDLPIIDRDKDGVASKDDCNDLEATIYPGAPEYCDGLDNNCDGETDTPDALDAQSWYLDADLDGFGDPASLVIACYQPDGLMDIADDCDDTDPMTYPGAIELCDGKDTDCDPATLEQGRVLWTDGLEAEDITESFTTGTSSSPIVYVAEKAGEIQLCEGHYFALVEVRTDLVLRGSGAPEANVLDGGLSGTILRVIGPESEVHIEGLTLQSGAATDEAENRDPYGGAISCEGAIDLTILNCVIHDSIATSGGGLGNQGCTIKVENTTFRENSASHKGGAVYQESGTMYFESVQVTANTAALDGGGLHLEQGEATVLDSDFLLNESKRGGAISVRTGSIHLEQSLIRQNDATVAGGLLLEGFLAPADATLVGTLIRQNQAFSGGGMVLNYNSGATCTGTPEAMGGFVQNQATEGGGILILDTTRDTVFESIHCTFGSAEHGEENTPDDLRYFGGNSYDHFGVDTNTVCTTAACTAPLP